MKIQTIVGTCLVLVAWLVMTSDALAQQPTGYPNPGPGPDTIPTFLQQDITRTGCQDPTQDGSSSPSFATTEYLFAPFFFANGFPTTDAAPAGPAGSLPFSLSDILTLANGDSEYQGSVTLIGTDLTGVFCTSGSEREFTLEESWYADEKIQAGADRDTATAG